MHLCFNYTKMEIFALFPSLFDVMWPGDSPDTIATTVSITVSVGFTTLSSSYCCIMETELWRREQYRMKPEWKSHFKCGGWKFNPNLWNSPEIKEVSVSLKGRCLPDSSGDGNKQLAAASPLLLSCACRCWRPEHLFSFSSLIPDIFEFEPIISHLQRSIQRWNTAFRGENFLLLPKSTCREQRAGNKVCYRGDVITLPLSTEITPLPQERAAQPQMHTNTRNPPSARLGPASDPSSSFFSRCSIIGLAAARQ